jgi:hypothetical protein
MSGAALSALHENTQQILKHSESKVSTEPQHPINETNERSMKGGDLIEERHQINIENTEMCF